MWLNGELLFDEGEGRLSYGSAVWANDERVWQIVDDPRAGQAVSPRDAIRLMQAANPFRGLPVGIIGPKRASGSLLSIAHALGEAIAGLKLPLVCGGKTGVMEAACKGAKQAGGLTIGILPDEDWALANPYVDIPLATGLGPARNAIIARACPVLIAVGGEYGTLTEMAFGLHFNRHVIALGGAPEVAGARYVASVDEAMEMAALAYLNLPPFAAFPVSAADRADR